MRVIFNPLLLSFPRKAMVCLAAACFILTLGAAPAFADAVLSNLSVIFQGRTITVQADLDGAFSPELDQAIQSGLTTSFEFTIRLVEVRKFWVEPVLWKRTFQHSVTYNNLERQYAVSVFEGEEEASKVTEQPGKMQKIMGHVNRTITVPTENWPLGKTCRIEVRAHMDTYKLPPPFSVLLFFVSINFDTPWARSSEFTITPEGREASP